MSDLTTDGIVAVLVEAQEAAVLLRPGGKKSARTRLAELVGVKPVEIGKWEDGKSDPPAEKWGVVLRAVRFWREFRTLKSRAERDLSVLRDEEPK